MINSVLKLLGLLESTHKLLQPLDVPDTGVQQAVAALDDHGKVVKEILDSERKYVQDLEVLQVCRYPLVYS